MANTILSESSRTVAWVNTAQRTSIQELVATMQNGSKLTWLRLMKESKKALPENVMLDMKIAQTQTTMQLATFFQTHTVILVICTMEILIGAVVTIQKPSIVQKCVVFVAVAHRIAQVDSLLEIWS